MAGVHGGDIYRNQVKMDFSVNINPLGMPEEVERAMRKAIGQCGSYPDIKVEKLKQAVGQMLAVPQEYLLFGNGASELFMAIIHGLRPKKILIPVPSFYGYEYAAKAGEGEILYYRMEKEDGFCVTEDVFRVLTEDVGLLFLANPNNPTGNLLGREMFIRILRCCRDKGIYVALDECFIEFCGEGCSMVSKIAEFENLILVRAFTKIFAIPGVRLGYLVCNSQEVLRMVKRQLPEWNISCFAQAAGEACTKQREFVRKTVGFVREEREFLEKGVERLGVLRVSSGANFLLVYSERDLYKGLLKEGVLIRDCRNFRGLGKGFYRIAVKRRKENVKVLEIMERVLARQ